MKAKLLISFLLALLTVSVWGQQITEQQAKERVLQFLSDNASTKARGLSQNLQMEAAKMEAQSIYAFNLEGGGYIIASGDSRALPVLGYSNKGSIDWDRMPANMRYWLKQYDEATKTLGKNKNFRNGNSIFAKAKTRASRAAIAPLIKTTWDQGEPYWDNVPLYDGADITQVGNPNPTGCVATAMAQVMNYWQWPKASPALPAYDQETAYEGKEKIWNHPALPAVTFDWTNMLDTYKEWDPYAGQWNILGTEAQRSAVATLMQYCGQSVYMDYSPTFSGSMTQYVSEALAKYFCYDGGVRTEARVKYTIDEWEDLLYDELAGGRPVIYGGAADDSGHEFVCDGYDGAGLYHINWGWSGSGDGYFSLSLLNPYNNESYGSSSSSIGFCITQDMIIGCHPAPEGTAPTIIPPSVYLIEESPFDITAGDGTVKVNLCVDTHGRQVTCDYGLGTLGEDGSLTPLFTGKLDEFVPYTLYYFLPVTVDKKNPIFSTGEFVMLYPMVKLSGGEWQLVGSLDDFIFAGIDKQQGLTFAYYTADIEITNAKMTGGYGRVGTQSQISFTIKNVDNVELHSPILMVPRYYGNIDPSKITGDTPFEWGDWYSSAVYLHPAETADVPFSFKPMDSGTIICDLYSPRGTYMGSIDYKMDDVIGCYDDFVRNDSYLDADYIYTRDYQHVSYTEGDELRPGHYTWHVCFTDNNAPGKPNGRPSENIYAYGAIRDIASNQINKQEFTEEVIDYLTKLPTNGGDGTWQFTFDLDLDIRLGGFYAVRSYFNEFIDMEKDDYIMSSWAGDDFVVYDDAAIHVVGDTILTSGQELNLELQLNTGFPYDASQFTGSEQGRWTLYYVQDDGTLVEQQAKKWSLGFDNSNPNKALASSVTLTGAIADGHYILRIDSDWDELGTRDVNLFVGTTGINSVSTNAKAANGPYTDLQGRRHDVLPARKGIYINNGRKVVVK